MEGMVLLMGMLAKAMLEEMIVEKFEECVSEYKQAKLMGKSDEELTTIFKSFMMPVALFIQRADDKDPFEQQELVERIKRNEELLSPNKS